jgi:hypothetical protein
MKNEHIELVKKWLADNDSVSLEELVSACAAAARDANAARAAGREAARAADAARSADADRASSVRAATRAAAAARTSDAVWAARDAAYWVKKYEELTKGDRHA